MTLADLTLNDLFIMSDEAGRRDLTNSWMIATLTRTSKFPSLDQLVSPIVPELTEEKAVEMKNFLTMAQADLNKRCGSVNVG